MCSSEVENVSLSMQVLTRGHASAHHGALTFPHRYVLLRGRKRFRLFSPADAHRMYTHGRIRKVHSNGRINYVGHVCAAAEGC